MTDTGLNGIVAGADEAAGALGQLEASARETAAGIDEAFGRAGESLALSLARAASDGKVSVGELVAAVIRAFEAAQGAGGSSSSASGLGAVLSAAVASFGGARADGGLVAPGQAYLVGERGPEVFRPAVSGQVDPVSGAPNVVVNLSLGGSAAGLVRSEAQLASALSRAVRLGGRRW